MDRIHPWAILFLVASWVTDSKNANAFSVPPQVLYGTSSSRMRVGSWPESRYLHRSSCNTALLTSTNEDTNPHPMTSTSIATANSATSTTTPVAPTTMTATSMPSRNRKHQSRSRKKSRKSEANHHPHNRPLTEQELTHHVAHQYLTGSGGLLREHRSTINPDRHHQQSPQHSASSIHRLERRPALVLNADYQPLTHLPLSLWSWQDTIKAVFSGKVTIVDIYPDVTIRAANIEVDLPSVIALNDYVPQFHQRPAFTKRNVFLRDEYRCQYCNDYFHTRDLSLDHVVPRSQGGRLNWENAVTCCRKCNGRKGCLPVNKLRSIGMKLVREPFVPTQFELASVAGKMLPRTVHPTWAPYLGLSLPMDGTSSLSSYPRLEEELFLDE